MVLQQNALLTKENKMSKQRLSELIMLGYSSGIGIVAVLLAASSAWA